MIDRNLYRNPVPLDHKEHRSLRLARATGDVSAAAGSNVLFVAAAEFAEASREYPLVFVRAGDDAAASGRAGIVPMAVLGLREGENLYFDGARWDAHYVPACLRRYPFAMARDDGEHLVAVIDRDWSGWSGREGKRLFTDKGEPAPLLERMRPFLEQFEAEVERTRRVCARLRDEALLRDVHFDAPLPDGSALRVDGFLAIDERKLAALASSKLAALQRDGVLAMIHLHQASLGLLHRLVERRLAREKAN